MPVIKTKGAASSQGFGEFAKSGVATYIEDVFSTWLYTGTGAAQTITNNIDLSTKGGLTWIKSRSAATVNKFTDTIRGATKALISSTTAAETTDSTGLTAFGTTGFTIGADANYNTIAETYVSWTFRKQPKFFDVVTYTGTGSNRTIAHSLGSVPGCIIVKRTDTTGAWQVYHSSLANTEYLVLNTTAAKATGATRWNSTTPTSTVFSVGTDATVNASGGTYVAYIYASNAGGFGLTGTDNVITCGSYTGNGSTTGPSITLGYEPQFVLIKDSTLAVNDWVIVDSMRGMPVGGAGSNLFPNLANAENATQYFSPTATGFTVTTTNSTVNGSGNTYIYIAIRRGPMKVPTSGTSVYAPITYTGNNTNPRLLNFSLNLDAAMFRKRNSAVDAENPFGARLLGTGTSNTTDTSAETPTLINNWASNVGVSVKDDGKINGTASFTYVSWGFKRAPSFMDVVCYTGTGANATQTHNLSAVPEMMIVKKRSATANWAVYHSALGAAGYAILNTTAASTTSSTFWQSTTPTSTNFYTGTNGNVGDSGQTYVAYLFATCAGVSKVGSYTGTGATQTISCGFTGGARFVLVKRTDTTGDWYVWDTARGMVSGTDPSLLLNSTAAEVNANSIYTATGGFQIVSTAAGINASGGTYIFLAIA